MNFLPQLFSLLTEPPGNILYHLVTLFALQAVFAVSLSQWLRERTNGEAWRGLVAAGGMVAGRVLLLALGLLLANDLARAVATLPPLEQAFNMATAVFLIWALVLPSPHQPRLGAALLLLSLPVITLLAISFTLAWQPLASAGIAYAATTQAAVWLALQIGVYGIGLALVLLNRYTRTGLQPFVMLILLGTAVAALLNLLGGTAVDTALLAWTRLGYLLAFPLWAALAYRQSITPLAAAHQAGHPAVRQLAQTLHLATQTLQSFNSENRMYQIVSMLQQMIDAGFIGVGFFPPEDKQLIYMVSNLPQAGADAPRSWHLDLVEWPPFRTAVRKKEGVELLPDGQGIRHLHVLYEAMALGPFGALLVQPMFVANEPVGMLLLAKNDGRLRWSAREKALAPALAAFAAQAISNCYRPVRPPSETAVPAPIIAAPDIATAQTAVSGRLIALEAARDKLAADLETATNRAAQAEMRAVVAMKRAHDLAQTLEEIERVNRDERTLELEREISALRESLMEAEDAMALAAAGENELSTEWIMLAITRYSGQLEEAQARIEALQTELSQRESGVANELLVALIQELRTPMTSIGGFTDLLLGETMGILGTRQRDFLQRVQANTRRMDSLLEQMLQLVASREKPSPAQEEIADIQEAIETAVTHIMPQVRDKNLRLDMEIPAGLPPLAMKPTDLQQMVGHLLSNACQAAGNNGQVIITSQAAAIQHPSHADGPLHFLQITVSDSGSGIHPDELAHVFNARHRADAPLIKGLGDTGAGLSVTHALAHSNGGRLWVDSTVGAGSTFSLLFPLPDPDGETAVPLPQGSKRTTDSTDKAELHE